MKCSTYFRGKLQTFKIVKLVNSTKNNCNYFQCQLICWLISQLIDELVGWSIKCLKIEKHDTNNFQGLTLAYLNCMFCLIHILNFLSFWLKIQLKMINQLPRYCNIINKLFQLTVQLNVQYWKQVWVNKYCTINSYGKTVWFRFWED